MTPNTSRQYIGIEIGGTKLQLIVADGSSNVTARARHSIDPAGGAENIRKQVSEGIEKLLSVNKICAIGVGFGGPVDWKTGAIQLSHQVDGWANYNLKTWLEDLTGLPVAVDNDANTAALAEAMHGCGRGHTNVFYMTVGSGIGGGMIMDGKIYHGRTPGEVEIGHLRLDKSGLTLENKCSGWAVNKRVRTYIETNPYSQLALLSKEITGPEAYLLKPALDAKDPDAMLIMQDVADDISLALSHVVHLCNPDVIIIGGGLSLLGERFRLAVAERLPFYIMQALLPAPIIKIAALSEDAVPIGAVELARQLYITSHDQQP